MTKRPAVAAFESDEPQAVIEMSAVSEEDTGRSGLKVLLIQPPHFFNGQCREPTEFPLGLGYVASVLEDEGHEVKVLNLWLHPQQPIPSGYDLYGITALSSQFSIVKELVYRIREKEPCADIVLGGALATHNPDLVKKVMDVKVVVGEGEQQVGSHDIRELDEIPFPAWHLFDMEHYTMPRRYAGSRRRFRPMNVISSRGCPYDCRFCSKTIQKVRLRSVENVRKEVEFLKEIYNVDLVKFDDELLMMSERRATEISEMLGSLDLHFVCNGRVNIVSPELLKVMRRNGCLAIAYGVESGSAHLLHTMNKRTLVEQNIRAIRWTLKAGIHPIINMMFGWIGENDETVRETVGMFKQIPFTGEKTYLGTTTPLPGSWLYQHCLDVGQIVNEEKYLEGLAAGYCRFGGRMLVNFTEFKDEDFEQKRLQAEKQILRAQILHHPSTFLTQVGKRLIAKYLTPPLA